MMSKGIAEHGEYFRSGTLNERPCKRKLSMKSVFHSKKQFDSNTIMFFRRALDRGYMDNTRSGCSCENVLQELFQTKASSLRNIFKLFAIYFRNVAGKNEDGKTYNINKFRDGNLFCQHFYTEINVSCDNANIRLQSRIRELEHNTALCREHWGSSRISKFEDRLEYELEKLKQEKQSSPDSFRYTIMSGLVSHLMV